MKLKWTIHELIKKAKNEEILHFSLDLNHYINEKHEDLERIEETKVLGKYTYFEDRELFIFELNIKSKLIMLCSLTLKEVEVNLDFDTEINFSTEYVDDDTHIIEGITIELDQYVFSEILIEKPMKVYAKNALNEYHEDIFEATEEEVISTSPFAKLKK
jgi:uncharacterized metal-binding protein YceD (DUF177 family)